ncbi:MAG: hypothetical protein MSIBF_00655 [Candidatus Altiarchaeales archaeon IMC4]|nr:MAG: hypothetical protein MSIBF_00655 [Candidatus Altiarchaeales archaeon IMC4]
MIPSKKRNPFGLFGPDFMAGIEEELAMMQENIERIMSETMSMEPGEGGPFVWGFSMRTGPDGKSVINEFGNVPAAGNAIEASDIEADEREPLVDVIEGEREVTVIAELPGIRKEDIDLSVSDCLMSIIADTPDRKYHKEVALPCEVMLGDVKANYKNGVLEVRIPKAGVPKGKKVKVE